LNGALECLVELGYGATTAIGVAKRGLLKFASELPDRSRHYLKNQIPALGRWQHLQPGVGAHCENDSEHRA